MNIVVLYSEVMGYTQGILEALAHLKPEVQVHVVYWDKRKLSAYSLDEGKSVKYYPRSSFDVNRLKQFLLDKMPPVIFVSGWMDKEYLSAIKWFKKNNKTRVVSGIDDQFHGRIRQYLGMIVSRVYYKRIFDYMWVSGMPQYHYASLMGYKMNTIVSNLYSANSQLFSQNPTLAGGWYIWADFPPRKGL
ncbi:MAG: hypothetical protein IPH58_08940 [Sphingobacteriales bacterium]|nr:hypothetical protein [Sphingobacteriales bacterium]